MRRVVVGAAILLAVVVTGRRAGAQTIKMDVPAGLVLSTETAPKKGESKASKGIFKDLRPGQCKVTMNSGAPVSSWPARGEPLVAVCRP